MAANAEPSGAMSVEELRELETHVLKALCLTINTAGSELKYKILDGLGEDDFYFPLTKCIYQTLFEMHRRGDYVISANLGEELGTRTELPADFVVEKLFEGSLPSLGQLSDWVLQLKERSRSGIIPSVKPPSVEKRVPSTSKAEPDRRKSTLVQTVAAAKQKVEEERRRSQPNANVQGAFLKSSPAISSVPKSSPAPAPAPAGGSSPAPPSGASIDVDVDVDVEVEVDDVDAEAPARGTPEKAAPVSTPVTGSQEKKAPSPVGGSQQKKVPAANAKSQPQPQASASAKPPKGSPKAGTAPKDVLASEGDDWDDYLEALAKKQGKHLDTGFAKLDEAIGGLSPGLLILVDEDRERLASFLKQLADQVAARDEARSLFLAGEHPKSVLRLRTLSRLSGVPAVDIERGKLKKDSKEWLRVEAEGRKAQSWLKRVFVHEMQEGAELAYLRSVIRRLQQHDSESGLLVVVESLDKLSGGEGDSTSLAKLAGLKALAEDLEVVVAAAASDPIVLSFKEADYAAVFRAAKDRIELDVLPSGNASPTTIPFVFLPAIGRFAEG